MALSCLLVLWVYILPPSSVGIAMACSIPTHMARNHARLRDNFDYAVRHRHGDVINLVSVEAAFSAQRPQRPQPNQPVVTRVRPVFGSSFTLACPVAHPDWIDPDDPATFPLWQHQTLGALQHNRPTFNPCPEPCFVCRCGHDTSTPPVSSFHQQIVSVAGRSSMYYELRISNTLSRFAGRYTCTERPPRGSDHINDTAATVEHFLVSPLYRASDIFVPAMRDASAPPGGSAEFYCNTRLEELQESPEGYKRRFIWYHERGVLRAPDNHPAKAYEIGAGADGLGSAFRIHTQRINNYNYTDGVGCCPSRLQIVTVSAATLAATSAGSRPIPTSTNGWCRPPICHSPIDHVPITRLC
ncbi:uncharacterized protein LOC129598321 [Paramacrobiotus metropolitanus]|uniref:uncharacterized protein LOC129598321 n=1 Tax=Paramacrobiotus metropolitanus TaxID=2943436 RepID=UPI002445BBFF|nr:uncharacterized protein LOC129598321 [Paramacrobiotus metropolitanus]